MLISNGEITRNISPAQLSEYEKKGYKEVKKKAAKKGGE